MTSEPRRRLPDVWINPSPGRVDETLPTQEVFAYHLQLPDYCPTPLRSLPAEAERLGIASVWVKEETWRLGLPSFKILGASWAVYRALCERFGLGANPDLSKLRAVAESVGPLSLLAATDGNHGRAVARMARLLGLGARIYVPLGTVSARIRAIESEGASVVVVDGAYDDAVRRAAAEEDEKSLIVSDTSWPGYERIPAWVSQGYATIFEEVDAQLRVSGGGTPTTVITPVGVGALASAAVRHYRASLPADVRVVSVEPTTAACLLRSLQAGHPVNVPGPHASIMAGLNCGAPSPLAWPLLIRAISVAVTIDDESARAAMRRLAAAGIEVGETGAASFACLTELLADADPGVMAAAGLGPKSSVLVLVTEGPTDPVSYERIVGRPPTIQIGH